MSQAEKNVKEQFEIDLGVNDAAAGDPMMGNIVPNPLDPHDPYDPNPGPLPDPKPWPNFEPDTKTVKNININLNYECPECGGRFRSWENHGISTTQGSKRCPFCHMEKGEYGSDEYQELREENRELEEQVESLKEKLEEIRDITD